MKNSNSSYLNWSYYCYSIYWMSSICYLMNYYWIYLSYYYCWTGYLTNYYWTGYLRTNYWTDLMTTTNLIGYYYYLTMN